MFVSVLFSFQLDTVYISHVFLSQISHASYRPDSDDFLQNKCMLSLQVWKCIVLTCDSSSVVESRQCETEAAAARTTLPVEQGVSG